MAYVTSQSKMVIAYNNRVAPEYISSVVLSNIGSDAIANNLAIEDPTKLLATTGTSGSNRVIDINFSAAWEFNCFGMANHNLVTQGYTGIDIGYWNGSSYASVGGVQSLSGVLGDPNFILRFPPTTATVASSVYNWRIILSGSGTRPAFSIGMVTFGTYYECEMNPEDGGVFVPTEIQMEELPTLGGIKYDRPGPARVSESAEINFKRIPQTMMNTLRGTIEQANRKKPIGIIWPEQVSYAMPNATQHFFGKISRMTPSPRSAMAPPHKYDLTIAMRGIL